MKFSPAMTASEDGMDEEKPGKRKTTPLSRSARNKRIVERLREGFGYDEIAREERLTGRRVRQIVTQALEGREALESAIHAHMQIDRLGQAMRVAGDALARGDVRAVAPFIKVVEKLDRYQSLARELAPKRQNMSDGDKLVVENLVARIRSQVLEECRTEAEQAVAAAAAVPAPDEGDAVAPPLAPEPQPAAPPRRRKLPSPSRRRWPPSFSLPRRPGAGGRRRRRPSGRARPSRQPWGTSAH